MTGQHTTTDLFRELGFRPVPKPEGKSPALPTSVSDIKSNQLGDMQIKYAAWREYSEDLHAQANYEYPVRRGVALDPIIGQAIGELKVDALPLAEIAHHRKQASMLVDKVGFDR